MESGSLSLAATRRIWVYAALVCSLLRLANTAYASDEATAQGKHGAAEAPPGMVWIAGGEFTMGTNDPRSLPNERPAHRVKVGGFWMDEQDVTNADFEEFVKATGNITIAEKKPDWEEIKKQLPPGTPKPDDSVLVPGSLVFTATPHPVGSM